jgi:hypothetical protein
MKTKTRRSTKPYWEMTSQELDEATKEFDEPIPLSQTRALTKTERRQFERSRRGPTFSVFVVRNDDVFVRLPPDVVRRSMKFAAAHKMTLSEVISRGLKGLLAFAE